MPEKQGIQLPCVHNLMLSPSPHKRERLLYHSEQHSNKHSKDRTIRKAVLGSCSLGETRFIGVCEKKSATVFVHQTFHHICYILSEGAQPVSSQSTKHFNPPSLGSRELISTTSSPSVSKGGRDRINIWWSRKKKKAKKKTVGKQQDVIQKGIQCFLWNNFSLSAQNMENSLGMAMKCSQKNL